MPATGPAVLRFPMGAPSKRQFGERLRLVIKEGTPLNTCFCLLGTQVVLGREAVCDVHLEDSKVSRRHVELVWKSTHYHAKDLGSQNGFILNGQRTTQATLNPGDTLVVGATILEVQAADGVNLKPQAKVAPKPLPAALLKESGGKNRALVIGGLLLLLLLIFSGKEGRIQTFRERAKIDIAPETQTNKKHKKEDNKEALADFIPNYIVDARNPDSEIFFRSGVRELQNKNFLRAMTNFDTALSIDPDHDLAKVYKKITKDEFDREVSTELNAAIRARKALRLREARMHYERALNYLETDKDNVEYVKTQEALKALDQLEGKMQ